MNTTKDLITNKFRVLTTVACMIACMLALPSRVNAQEVSLSISPPLTEITIQPGKTFNQIFTLKNDGVPVTVTAKIIPFVPLDNQGHAELVEDQNSIDVFSDWFSFDQSPISIGTVGSQDFIVKIAPPEDVEQKDYYFTFLIEVQNENSLGVNTSLARARIGANILLTVSKEGNPAKKASILVFSAPKFVDSFNGLTYKVIVDNLGSTLFKPVGKITVNQLLGKTTTLLLAPLNVLVGGTREINCVEGEGLVPCKLPGKFLIGIYRADLSFTIDDSGSAIEKQIYTIAFPFSITLGLISIFIIFRIIKKFIPHI